MATTSPNWTATPGLRSPALISATVVLAAFVGALQASAAAAVLSAAMILTVVACAVVDLECRIIPNRITGPAAGVAVALGLVLDPAGEPKRLLWAAIAGGFLFVFAMISPKGMGMGDVKLLAVMGLFLGRPLVIALLVALLANVVAGAVIAGRRGVGAARKTTLPFGPFLAAGGVVAALVGAQIIDVYLKLHG
jgi:leader peptidase (prepilin peptidase)/N-methyltransferase